MDLKLENKKKINETKIPEFFENISTIDKAIVNVTNKKER